MLEYDIHVLNRIMKIVNDSVHGESSGWKGHKTMGTNLRPWWSRFFCQFMLPSAGIESISFSAKLSQINRQVGNTRWLHAVLISVLEPEPIDGGAEIELPPGAKALIMIYGYGSESLLFFQRLKILWKKVIGVVGVAARVLSVTRAFLPLRRSRVWS